MRKNALVLTAVAVALLMSGVQPSHAQSMSPAKLRAMGIRVWDGQMLGTGSRPGELVFMGEISRSAVDALKKELASNPGIDTIVVDTQGGHMNAALDIADILRTRNLRLVVDGRCLSACAHYLFPAAPRKTVLPGSIVGIHGGTYYDQEGDFLKTIPSAEAGAMLRSSGRQADYQKLEAMLMREAAFYRELKIDTGNHRVFQDYLQHRKQALANQAGSQLLSTTDCPQVEMWALDQAQLEAMGVRGIEQFWYPSDAKAQQQVMHELGIERLFFHFGSAAKLEGYCAPSWRERWTRWLASFKSTK